MVNCPQLMVIQTVTQTHGSPSNPVSTRVGDEA